MSTSFFHCFFFFLPFAEKSQINSSTPTFVQVTRTIAKALNPRAAIISNRSLSPLALTFVQVARTVAFVRSSSLLLSIRAGGPSTSGPARELNSPFNRPSQPLISTPQAVFICTFHPVLAPGAALFPQRLAFAPQPELQTAQPAPGAPAREP